MTRNREVFSLLLRNKCGQAMTEYILTFVLIFLLSVPMIKLIPKAFGYAFNRIANTYLMKEAAVNTGALIRQFRSGK